nr:MAG: putative coat protein [Tombusviridae sp.]
MARCSPPISRVTQCPQSIKWLIVERNSLANTNNKRNTRGQGNKRPAPTTNLQKQGFTQPQVMYRTGRPKVRSLGDRIVVSNTEIAIEVNGTIATGTIPASGAIRVFRFEDVATGNNMNNTRWLTKLAKAYDKFKIRKLHLRWVPSLPVTYGGQVALRWDSDPSKTTADTGLLAVSGDMRAVATAVYNSAENHVLTDQMNRLPQYETFPQTGDTGIATVGSINLAYSGITPPAGVTGTVNIGYVWMDYEVEFLNPSAGVNA